MTTSYSYNGHVYRKGDKVRSLDWQVTGEIRSIWPSGHAPQTQVVIHPHDGKTTHPRTTTIDKIEPVQ